MELLIYGATEVAFLLASRLHQKHNVTLLSEESPGERFTDLDVSIVQGSAGDIGLLEEIDAGKKKLFIACSELDEANIVACWTLKKLGDIETICFLSKADLNHNFASSARSQYRTRYDLDSVIWPEQLLVQDIFRILSVPHALDVEYLAGGRARLFEYRIWEESKMAGKMVLECDFPKGVLIGGIMRKGKLFIPDGRTVIEKEDKVFFLGQSKALDDLAARFFHSRNEVKRVSIIGGGEVGFMLAQRLEVIGVKVKLIEVNARRCDMLADTLKTTLVLNGDGTDLDLLESESIAKADACICITNNDEKNLLCSLLVKQLGSQRIITRAETMQNYRVFEHVGIDVVVSPKASALTEVLNCVHAHEVNVVAVLEGDSGEVLRLTLPDDYTAVALKNIKLPARAVVGTVLHNRELIVPDGKTMLNPGDQLEIFTMKEDSEKVRKFFFT